MTHTKLRVLVAAAAAAAMASSVPRSTPSAAQADAAGEIPGQHAQPVPGATTVQGRVLLANSGSGVDRNYVVVDVAGTGVLVDLQRPAASVGVGDSVRVTGVVEPDGEIDDGVIERLPFPPRQPVALRVPLTPSAMGGAAGHLVVATARVRSRERRNGRTSLVVSDPVDTSVHVQVRQRSRDRTRLALNRYGPGDAIRITGILSLRDSDRDSTIRYSVLPRASEDVEAIGLTRAAVRKALGFAGTAVAVAALIAGLGWLKSRRREARRNGAERRLQAMYAGATDAILLLDSGGQVIEANAAAHPYVGGRDIDTRTHVRSLVASSEQERFLRVLAETEVVGVGHGEFPLITVDREARTVDVRLTAIDLEGERRAVAVLRDVTHQRDLETQLHQALKMESIGQLAGGVAHDFNNLLTVITSYAGLLQDTFATADARRTDVEEIGRAAERASGLTRQLLAFSRRQVLRPERIDLRDAVRGLEQMLRRLIPEDIAIAVHRADEPCPVLADRAQLEQMVINLAINARDAMPGGGTLTIEVRRDRADTAAMSATADRPIDPAGYATLVVRDTGIGMDAPTRARIFEPFFTTKQMGRGTGLGLSTVYGFVRQSNGAIACESAPQQGTTFIVSLPLAVEGPEVPEVPSGSVEEERSSAGATVLLVEDDQAVRAAARRTLAKAGWRVIEAGTAREARALADSAGNRLAAVVSDVVLPDGSGVGLIEWLTDRHPSVSAILVSGYPQQDRERCGELDKGIAFVEKPFTPTQLVAAVRSALLRRPPAVDQLARPAVVAA